MNMELHKAIYALDSRITEVSEIDGNFVAFDSDGNEVSFDLAELDATQYQRDRQPEYPSLADLADALYWSNQGDNTKLDEYYQACAAVKAKYPKP